METPMAEHQYENFGRILPGATGNATEGRHLGIFRILIVEMKALIEPDNLAWFL